MRDPTGEYAIQKSLKRITAWAVLAIVVLIMAVLAAVFAVNSIFTSSYKASIGAYTNEFSTAVKKQAAGDIDTVLTLSSFIHSPANLNDNFVHRTQSAGNFEVIGFWSVNGESAQVSLSGVRFDSHFNNLNPASQKAIIAAWSGINYVSDPFYSPAMHMEVITYAVPIFDQDGNIEAALSAVKSLGSFDQIISQLGFFMPDVDLMIINRQGRIVACNNNIFELKHLNRISSLSCFDAKQQNLIEGALSSDLSVSFDFRHDKRSYTFNLIPMGIADWSVVSIDHKNQRNSPIYFPLRTLFYILCSILVAGTILGCIAFYMMKRGYQKQLCLAAFDPLTGCYNLSKFSLELGKYNFSQQRFALMSLNIRDFSFINEYLEPEDTDRLLIYICNTLTKEPQVRMVCREHADQFYLLFEETDKARLQLFFERFSQEISQLFDRNFSLIPVVLYAGCVLCRKDDDAGTVMHKLEVVQRLIPHSYHPELLFYSDAIYQREINNRFIESEMRPALQRHEFKLFLQPKLDLKSNTITGAEALVRWIKQDGSVVMPGEFIPLFERNGFCAELDLYIFELVCQKIRHWQEQGITPLHVSVNQSKLLLLRPNYADSIRAILSKYRIPAHYIVIEILESVAVRNIRQINALIRQLHGAGVSVSMDDFGSGYSSLNMLSGLSVDEVKFDKEFLLEPDRTKKQRNRIILSHLLQLVHSLGMQTVVEGVDTAEDVEFLRQTGCNLGQGFFLGKPTNSKDFDRLFLKEQLDKVS